MFIKQISIFLENKKGALSRMANLLGEEGINLLAMSIADTDEFGIVRIIVPSESVFRALIVLREEGMTAKISNVVCVRIPHEPLGLAMALDKFAELGISIEYSYSFCSSKSPDAVAIFRIQEDEKILDKLKAVGVDFLTTEEVDKF